MEGGSFWRCAAFVLAGVVAGVLVFSGMLAYWAVFAGAEPSFTIAALGMIPSGIGVGLTFPTLMGVGAAALPPSSFATGSGVINMIRQAALAIGVAIFVAVLGTATVPAERIAAFHHGWWLMAAITLLGLLPALRYLRHGKPQG